MLKWFWNGAAIAASVLIPASAHAQLAASPSDVAATKAASSAVENFYSARRDAPLWFKAGRESAEALELVRILRRAPVDGLARGPELARQIEHAIANAQSGDRRAIAGAERMMSRAWIDYVQAVRAPTAGMIYGDPGMSAAPPPPAIILRDAARAPSLGAYLAAVSQVNPTYAALRNAALAEADVPGGAPPARLLANLDRARAIPATGRFLLVDAAAARLWMYEDGRAVDSMKVIVGKPQYATPMIASKIHYATLNPYWHVPDHLVRELVATAVVKQGTDYLTARGYQLVSDFTDRAEVLSAASVDWKKVASGETKVKVRQLPGETNSMGAVKFPFANGEGIYLHDTPDKALFAEEQRTLSNGCVRLADAPKLSRWLMGSDPQAASTTPEQHVRLPQAVPIYITYLTATPDGGALSYSDDFYGRDEMSGEPTGEGALAKTAAIR